MYYLQSRYYDPAICRFINADGLASTGQGIIGHNMYVYCGNNPVIGYDPTGLVNWGGVLAGLGMGIAAVLAVAATVAAVSAASPLIMIAGATVGTAMSAAIIETSVVTTVGAITEEPVVYDITATSSHNKFGYSVVYDFGENTTDVYFHEGVQTNNDFGITYGSGFVFNYDKPGDYGGEFYDASYSKDLNGANIGIDGCADPGNITGGNGSWAILLTSGMSISNGFSTPVNFSYDYYWQIAVF